MSISHYSYKYGHGSKEFSLESDRVIKEVTVAKMPLLEDVKAAILDARLSSYRQCANQRTGQTGTEDCLYLQRSDTCGQQFCLYAHSGQRNE